MDNKTNLNAGPSARQRQLSGVSSGTVSAPDAMACSPQYVDPNLRADAARAAVRLSEVTEQLLATQHLGTKASIAEMWRAAVALGKISEEIVHGGNVAVPNPRSTPAGSQGSIQAAPAYAAEVPRNGELAVALILQHSTSCSPYERASASQGRQALRDAPFSSPSVNGHGAQDHRVLLFSQSRAMLDVLEALMRQRRWRYSRIDGSTPAHSRPGSVQTNKDRDLGFETLAFEIG